MYVCVALLMTTAAMPLTASAEEQNGGSQVVGENDPCPSGMVVSGMTGGEGDITKICVTPNSPEMPEDTTDVGDYSNPENP
jgi:hypothetical protein